MKFCICDKERVRAFFYFCKRVTYEDAYSRAHGKTEKEREAMAYRILGAFGEIEECFYKEGQI